MRQSIKQTLYLLLLVFLFLAMPILAYGFFLCAIVLFVISAVHAYFEFQKYLKEAGEE